MAMSNLSQILYIDIPSKAFSIQPDALHKYDYIDLYLHDITDSDVSANTLLSIDYEGDTVATGTVIFESGQAVFPMNLSSVELLAIFDGKSDSYAVNFNILIQDNDDSNIILNSLIPIQNIPAVDDPNLGTPVFNEDLGNLTEDTSSVLTIIGGGNAIIGEVTIQVKVANTTQSGYLTSTDWNTFNNKSELVLGETSITAYRGDRGKIAYDHSQTTGSNPHSVTASEVGLGNVTNESKSTMFTSPTFTGTVTIPTPFTIGAISVTATGTELNYVAGVTSAIQTQINDVAESKLAKYFSGFGTKTTIVDADTIAGNDSENSGSPVVLTFLKIWNYIKVKADLVYNAVITNNVDTDGTVAGQLKIWDDAGGTWDNAVLTEGANVTITGGDGSITIASAAPGTGDVVGPGSSTDHAIARFDLATGKLIQDSVNTLTDIGKLNFPDIATTGTMNMVARSVEPSAPASGDIYLDDGTNTASTNKGWRRYNGTTWDDLGALSGGLTYVEISTDTAAVSGNFYIIDASGGTVTLTLPVTPLVNEKIGYFVLDKTNTVTISRNGSNIKGAAADLTPDDGISEVLSWSGDATEGWFLAYDKTFLVDDLDFVDGDLTVGVLTITGLKTIADIIDNSGNVIIPDEIIYGGSDTTVDLSSYGTLTGTWKVKFAQGYGISGGGISGGGITETTGTIVTTATLNIIILDTTTSTSSDELEFRIYDATSGFELSKKTTVFDTENFTSPVGGSSYSPSDFTLATDISGNNIRFNITNNTANTVNYGYRLLNSSTA